MWVWEARGRFVPPPHPDAAVRGVQWQSLNPTTRRGVMKPFEFVEVLEEWELPLSANFTVKPPMEDTSEFVIPPDLDLTNVV